MNKHVLIFGLLLFAGLYSCQKETLSATDVVATNASVTDRGGDPKSHHGHMPLDSLGQHHHDSLWHQHLDSLWQAHHDSLGHPHNDSLGNGHPHHDSTGHPPHDTAWTPGNGHPHQGGPHQGPGACTPSVELITVADLPQAAQDWLTANQGSAAVESVVKNTKPNCEVYYFVKFEDGSKVRFDADGNKIG